jgi:hypothetical protein
MNELSRGIAVGAIGGILLLGGAAGCSQNTEKSSSTSGSAMKTQTSSSPAMESSASGGGVTVTLQGLQWSVPAGMVGETPANTMRIAQYRLPSETEGTKDGELGVFYFGAGAGGGTEANLARWAGQFKQPDGSDPMKRAEVAHLSASGGLRATTISLSGHYVSSGMGSGPSYDEPGWKLYGAVVEGPGGPWFFKAVGPESVINAWQPRLQTMIQGLHPAS